MQVEREAFIGLLNKLKPALAAKGVVMELSHVWFDGDAAYANDGGFGIRIPYESDLDCGVPGAALLGLLQTSALKEATLEGSSKTMQVKLGKSTSKLAALEGDRRIWKYPAKLPKGAQALELDEEFVEALRKTLFIKASPATRVEHYGVMMLPAKGSIELFSTDNATMAQVIVPFKGKADFERALLPRDFAEQLVAQSPSGVDFYVLDDCLIACGDAIDLYSNKLDVSAADDMGAVIARHSKDHPEVVPLPAGLGAALSRAEVLAGSEDPAVTLTADGKSLKVVGNYALGSLNETLALEEKHPEAEMRVRAGLLKRALPYAESMSMTERTLRLTGEPGFVYLVSGL